MALTNAFNEAVLSGNIRRVRIMMKDSILNDPTLSEFNAMKNVARDLSGLYDLHDGRELNYDKSTWDDSYMNELMVQIVGNFSHERIDHLKDVVKNLRPAEIHSQEVHSNNRRVSYSEKTSESPNTHRDDYQKQLYHNQENSFTKGTKIMGGAIIGAVAGGAIAAVASASVICGVAIGAVSGTVTAMVITKGD